MKKRLISLALLATVVAAVYVSNASWRVTPEAGGPKLLAHRGVHQTYHREDLERDTCTAQRIDSPTHHYIENTIPSMRAAFEAGADVVELDVHPTTDGYFAVMHDWTIDCRTEGSGLTRNHSLEYLKSLDLGYGYTADNGQPSLLRGNDGDSEPELTYVDFSNKTLMRKLPATGETTLVSANIPDPEQLYAGQFTVSEHGVYAIHVDEEKRSLYFYPFDGAAPQQIIRLPDYTWVTDIDIRNNKILMHQTRPPWSDFMRLRMSPPSYYKCLRLGS